MTALDSKSAFDHFVEDKLKKAKDADWEAKKELWLSKVNELYSQVENWLADWVKTKQITLSKSEAKTVVEDHIGRYTVPVMKITIGDEAMQLNPIGTLIVGARGRVDVKGSIGDEMLVLLARDEPRDEPVKPGGQGRESAGGHASMPGYDDLVWKHVTMNPVASRSPFPAYLNLNKSLFEEILMSVSR